jgi:hypothetical protein
MLKAVQNGVSKQGLLQGLRGFSGVSDDKFLIEVSTR